GGVARGGEARGRGDLRGAKPPQLPGGQQQRVALGRSIVRHPQVFLFDEPLSNLDAKLRAQMRIELKRLRERVATTSIYVTHDQVEAMTLGDRVVVMREGRILQQGTPLEIYNRPRDRFVAGLIGAPAMNFLDVTLTRADGQLAVEAEGLRIRVPDDQVAVLERHSAGALTLGVRPEHVFIGDPRPENGTGFEAAIEVTE